MLAWARGMFFHSCASLPHCERLHLCNIMMILTKNKRSVRCTSTEAKRAKEKECKSFPSITCAANQPGIGIERLLLLSGWSGLLTNIASWWSLTTTARCSSTNTWRHSSSRALIRGLCQLLLRWLHYLSCWLRGRHRLSIATIWCTLSWTMHMHTHTYPFNGPFSGTTQVSQYQKGKTNLDFTEARDSEWHMHRTVTSQQRRQL